MSSPLDEIDAALAAHYTRLSPSQRRAIDRLVSDTRFGAVVTPVELARSVGVHPSTLTRAAQVLGFHGFPDLQARLRAGFLHVVPPATQVAAPPALDETAEAAATRVMLDDVECVRATLAALSPEVLQRVVAALVAARRVYVFGAHGAHGLALVLGLALHLLLPDTRVLRQDFGDLAEQLVGLDAADALLVVGFQRVDRVTQQLLGWARERGATTIGMTDHRSNPIARTTQHTLYVRLGAPHQIPSYPAAGASLINALATAIAVQTRGTTQGRMREVEHLWARFGARGES